VRKTFYDTSRLVIALPMPVLGNNFRGQFDWPNRRRISIRGKIHAEKTGVALFRIERWEEFFGSAMPFFLFARVFPHHRGGSCYQF